MLPCLVSVLLTFQIQDVLKFKKSVAKRLKEKSLINLIFQKREEFVQTFKIGPFQFTLEQVEAGMDVGRYRVKLGRFGVMMGFIGVNSWDPCENYWNVDCVYFSWQCFEQFGFRKHAITILPAPFTRNPLSNNLRLLCLRYYRAAGTVWNIYAGCVTNFARISAPSPAA